jgi:hypothetical protein
MGREHVTYMGEEKESQKGETTLKLGKVKAIPVTGRGGL